MSFLGLDLLDWTAIAAIGPAALAAATTAAVIAAAKIARTDRARDDAKRVQDREWDSDRRKEDRDRDDQLRRADMERDDQLRRADMEEWEKRARAEQREREDYEARQVTVEISGTMPPSIVVTAPAGYPVKQVEAQIAHWTGANLGTLPLGHAGSEPMTSGGRTVIEFPVAYPPHTERPAPIVRFIDRHSNLFYVYRQQTRRFPQGTSFLAAAKQIDWWISLGPKPDEA